MPDLTLAGLAPYFAIVATLVSLVSVWMIVLRGRQLRFLKAKWDGLTTGIDGENLEQLVSEQIRNVLRLESEIAELRARLQVAENRLTTSKRYVGLVRYDAFDDVGGQQSFSLAIYDDEGNGAVVTSQVGRSDCRVFGKQIVEGKADISLTVEEERAIETAANVKARPRINS